LLAAVLKGVMDKSKIDPKLVGDIVVGQVLAPGGGATVARMASFLAGIPETVPLAATNRQCSSGLQAFATIAAGIKSRYYDAGIAAGVESMSRNDMVGAVGDLPEAVQTNEKAAQCMIPMGITSENVAERFGVAREVQDRFSAESHKKAAAAQKAGKFDAEILPVTVTLKKGDETKTVTISKDEGIRADTTFEGLSKLKPAFKQGGTTTAGNSSQVSDGAAAVLAMRRSLAKKLGMQVLGTFRAFAVVGVPPDVMGIGPAFAIPEAVKQAGLTLNDIDVFEINEAFASQAVYCVQKLGIPVEKVNPNGGAIALGHPLGCTGARQISTLLYELKRRNARYGVISMCIGTGMGAAAVFEAEN
jgi:acetyl-CoA acyltransferase 1